MKPARQGVAIVTLLVVMAALSVILTVTTMQIVAQRKLHQQRHRQLQADWLARAGIELAAARLLDSPAAFRDDKNDLALDAKVRIVVEKQAPDVYDVTTEAAVGLSDAASVVRSAHSRFRRTEKDGTVRLAR